MQNNYRRAPINYFSKKALKFVDFLRFIVIFAAVISPSYLIYYFMNKTELVNAIAENAKITKVDAKAALDAAIAAVTKALAEGDKIALVGFGTFSVSEKSARTGINPRTKETIEIPARKVVKFKAGAELADKVK